MSEAVTNAEIEDVLSSIRRLVSENAIAEPRAVAPAPVAAPLVTPVEEAPGADMLVLTPAFRVHEAPAAEAASDPEPVPEPIPEPMLLSDPISAPVAEETPQEPEAPDLEAAELADLAWPEPETPVDPVAEAPVANASVAEVRPDSLEHRIAELEAVISETPGDWEPDGSEVEADEPQTVVFEHAAWSAREGGEAEEVEEVVEAPFVEAEMPVEEAEVISISPAAEALADPADPADPDLIEEEAEALFDEAFDEAVIDEEVLREMVQKLVREELQGTVGERITRNVRRLVRREIQRALTLRDFE
jgi:hypothetical protein